MVSENLIIELNFDNINLLSIVLPKLYSMTKKDYIEININILEYLLFVRANID